MVRDSLVEEIRSRADLVEICGEFMPLKRVGKSYRGPCPLHGGDDPNFSIVPSEGIFKCFVCGEGGDVFSFVMKHLGHDFPEAVRYVADRVGIQVPDERDDGEDPHAHVREALAFAEEWFADRLAGDGGSPALEYLGSRGIGPEQAREYSLGYAPEGWRGLKEAAGERGIEEEALLEAGLLATSERADEPYDRFRNRLIFSIQDLRDRPIGFGGRDLGGEEDVPKYINSPDSPVFHKGNTLYGLNWARHEMRRQEFATVVEGYTDALSLHTRGVETAVAPLGTALTPRQGETLTRYASTVYLVYDSDDAGLRATFKAADVVLAAGGHPMVVTLPEGEDPDSLVRGRGVEALRSFMEDAVDVLERKLQELEVRGYLDTIQGRRRAVDGLLSTLRAVRDPSLRDIYISRAAERIGVREETLRQEMAKAGRSRRGRAGTRGGGRGGPGREARGGGPGAGRATGESKAERTLLLLFLRDPSLVDEAVEAGLEPGLFQSERHADIFRGLRAAREEELEGAWGEVFEGDDRRLVEELLEDATELTQPDRIFEHSLGRVLNRPKLERVHEIERALEKDGLEFEEAQKLLREKERLWKELREAGVRQGWERRFLL